MADFGLTEDMYGTNYYRRMKGKTGDDEKVPIRWMPPESIENDVYNEKTDVVRENKHYGILSTIMFTIPLHNHNCIGHVEILQGFRKCIAQKLESLITYSLKN